MKKIMKIVGALCFASVLTSCGGSGGTDEKQVVKEKPCDCENLFMDPTTYKYQKGSKLYTGTCETRDQYDIVTKQLEFKNGFKVFQLIKQKVTGKYVTVDSVYYDGLNPINGFETHIMANGLGTYVDKFDSYTNGVKESGEIKVSSGQASIIYNNGSKNEWVDVINNGPGFVTEFTDKAKSISNKFQVFEIHK